MAEPIITLSEAAYQDLEDIEAYVAQSSPKMARNFINQVFNKLDLLRDFPRIGRKVPEFDADDIRELILGKYRIVYRIQTEDKITVARVIHGSRLMDL